MRPHSPRRGHEGAGGPVGAGPRGAWGPVVAGARVGAGPRGAGAPVGAGPRGAGAPVWAGPRGAEPPPRLRSVRRTAALLGLLFGVYAATLGLHAFGASEYGGDEPHYLLAAKSLVEDGDVDVKNQFAARE